MINIIKDIGILMIKDSEDILHDSLVNHAKYFKKILVQDGSLTNECRKICESFKEVVYYVHDKNVPGWKLGNGYRNNLLTVARKMYGKDFWITMLEDDKFWIDNPLKVIDAAIEQGCDITRWQALQFFLHNKDKPLYVSGVWRGIEVRDRVKYFCPGWFEDASYFDRGNLLWDRQATHDLSWRPIGVSKTFNPSKHPVYTHYSYRSPEQVKRQIENYYRGMDQGWHLQFKKNPFVDCLQGFDKVEYNKDNMFEKYRWCKDD